MSSTHGKKPLPLPAGLKVGLRGLGFKPSVNVTDKGDPKEPGPARWRHPLYPELWVDIAASNIPGDDHVLAAVPGIASGRVQEDLLLHSLRERVTFAKALR